MRSTRQAGGRRAAVTAVTAMAVIATAAAPATARVASATSPNPSYRSNDLTGVSAVSSSDVWAVGQYYNATSKAQDTLILHWTGSAWTQVPSPNPSALGNHLTGVSALSASNAWAVGYYDTTGGGTHTLILHWNGSSWTQVPSPDPTPGKSQLHGVSAVSTSDAWAVGDYFDTATNVDETLVLHWTGTAWTQVASPSPGSSDALLGVSADSTSDAWAVGVSGDRTLTLHWTGTAWAQVPSPNPSSIINRLSGVSAISGTDAWAVGFEYRSNTSADHTLILHWNGVAWSHTFSPGPGLGSSLTGVSAVSAASAWAVGSYAKLVNGVTTTETLILHWTGTAWRTAASPDPSSKFNVLAGVSADTASDAWAAGDYVHVNAQGQSLDRTLILHWTGSAWVRT
jgi:hypothetical protein